MRTTLARTFKLAALLSAAIVSAPSSAHAYRTLADVEGSPTPIVWEAPPAVALDSEGLTEEQAAQFAAELTASIDTWNAAACAGDAFSLAVEGEALVTVRLVADWTERGFNPTAAGTTDLVLASTMDGGTAIVGATISLNGTFAWGPHPQPDADGLRDLRAVITHELGHALGLEHSDDASSTMFATYAGASQAALALDDIAGLCSIYRAETVVIPPPSCATDDECERGYWCIEEQCHPELRYGSECTDGSDCFGARCVAEEGGGKCTFVCEEEADCPSGTACLQVMGRDERVCAAAGGSGCSISGGRTVPVSLVVLALGALALLVGRRSRRAMRPRLGAVLALTLTACGSSHVEEDGGGLSGDAGPMDAAPSDGGGASDAGQDAAPPLDAGTDAYVAPDTGPVPVCEPGAMRVGECGFCGMQGQTCDESGQWEGTSACLGEGECEVGSVETRDLELCAQEQRLCLVGCTWGEWGESRPAGACTPGTPRMAGDACPAGEIREEVCAADCTWSGTTACSNPCGVAPRSTPEWAREVCVPAGNFYRGSALYSDTQPVAEVYVSSFLIDAYPVTNRRYQQCVDAGACEEIPGGDDDLPARIDFPAQGVNRSEAVAFCAWDGGRRLPTEAEWEKAGRGPSPRMNLYPWEGATWDCDRAPSFACGDPVPGSVALPYDGLPGTRSYYGAFLQLAGTLERVADYYVADFYADPTSLHDPLVTAADVPMPPFGLYSVVRGNPVGPQPTLAYRASTSDPDPEVGFRCAHSAP